MGKYIVELSHCHHADLLQVEIEAPTMVQAVCIALKRHEHNVAFEDMSDPSYSEWRRLQVNVIMSSQLDSENPKSREE